MTARGNRPRGREWNFPEEWEDVEDIEEKYEALSYKKGKRKASSSSKYRERPMLKEHILNDN